MKNPREENATTGRTREALKNPLTWVFALFLLGYMGTEGNAFFLTAKDIFLLTAIQLVWAVG